MGGVAHGENFLGTGGVVTPVSAPLPFLGVPPLHTHWAGLDPVPGKEGEGLESSSFEEWRALRGRVLCSAEGYMVESTLHHCLLNVVKMC